MPRMTFELHVEMDDGTEHTVIADQRDVARWEMQPFGWPVSRLEDNASMAFFRYLAWSALQRGRQTSLKWETFNEKMIEAMPVDREDDDAEDPGNPAPSETRS